MNLNEKWWDVELEKKPDFSKCMERIYAWYNQEMIDRPPIQLAARNEDKDLLKTITLHLFSASASEKIIIIGFGNPCSQDLIIFIRRSARKARMGKIISVHYKY